MKPFVTITTTADHGVESYVRSCVAAFCTPLNPTLDEVNDIKTAVSEAVTNVVVHAYPDGGDRLLTVTVRLVGATVYIDVSDNGCGITDIDRARTAFYTSSPESERSGVGFTVMDAFMDGLEVTNRPEGGLLVSMKKRLCASACSVGVEQKGVACAGS